MAPLEGVGVGYAAGYAAGYVVQVGSFQDLQTGDDGMAWQAWAFEVESFFG